MILEDLRDVTFDVEQDGEEVRRTRLRRIWEGRGWGTVMLVFEERGPDGDWRAPKLTVIRFRRAGGGWKKHAQVTLPADQARSLAALLSENAGLFTGSPDDDDGE